MKTEIYDDIELIEQDEWDAMNLAGELFHSHSFLKALQKARVEDSDMYYLVIEDNGRVVGTAVLSVFNINLDLFIDVKFLIKLIKKINPGIFKTRVLFCGTPVSAGHKNIQALEYAAAEVYKAVAEAMESIAVRTKANTLIFKELINDDLQYADCLYQKGYFKGNSIPSTWMPVQYDHYEKYLKNLRHTYRRQIAASLKKAGMKLPFISNGSSTLFNADKPYIRYISKEEFNGRKFYEYYMDVMSRATVKLETLNADFFDNVFKALDDKLKLLAFVHGDEIVCVFAFTLYQGNLNFLWTGKKQDKDVFDSYHNLLNALVQIAIENRCEKIVLGQTSYYPKQRVGACTEDRFIYVKSRKPVIHAILRRLNPWLFPYLKVPELNVFKKQTHAKKKETVNARTGPHA